MEGKISSKVLCTIMVLFIVGSAFSGFTSAWKTDTGYQTTHDYMTTKAKEVLSNDGFDLIYDFLNQDYVTGQKYIDKVLQGNCDADSEWDPLTSSIPMASHYMNPITKEGLIMGYLPAKDSCQNQFNLAVDYWNEGNLDEAMYHLGWALHIIQDLTVPHHAALDPGPYEIGIPPSNSDHYQYEQYLEEDDIENYDDSHSNGIYSFSPFNASYYEWNIPFLIPIPYARTYQQWNAEGWCDYAAFRSHNNQFGLIYSEYNPQNFYTYDPEDYNVHIDTGDIDYFDLVYGKSLEVEDASSSDENYRDLQTSWRYLVPLGKRLSAGFIKFFFDSVDFNVKSPVAIDFEPTYGITQGRPVTFTGIIEDDDPPYYFWDFGDGNSEVTASNQVVHTYNSHGIYRMTLTGIDYEPDWLGGLVYGNELPLSVTVSTNTAPVSTLSTTAANWNNEDVTFTAAVSADDDGISEVSLYYSYSSDGSNWDPWINYNSDTEDPYSWTFNWPMGDGHYMFDSVAVDSLGFSEFSPSSSTTVYRYDATAPSLPASRTSPISSTSEHMPLFRWSASDDYGGSGVMQYHLEVTNGYVTYSRTTTNNYYQMDVPLTDGFWYWQVRAEDNLGNQISYLWSTWSVEIYTYIPPPPPPPPGRFSGYIRDSLTGSPISGAQISVYYTPLSAPSPGPTLFGVQPINEIKASTNIDGYFSMYLTSGTYNFEVTHWNHLTKYLHNIYVPSAGIVMNIYMNSDACFLAGTKIQMANNTEKDIEDIKSGEMVLTYNENTDDIESNEVISTSCHIVDEYLVINDQLHVTKNHPVYADGLLVKADDLRIGDSLSGFDGNIIINSIDEVSGTVNVYNLEIENNHNYYADNVLVHNKAPPEDDPPEIPPNWYTDPDYDEEVGYSQPSCFPAGTKVATDFEVEINIEDLRVGDIVLSCNKETGLIEPNEVLEVFVHEDDDYLLINNLKITSNHPIYVNGLVLPACDIQIGDYLTDISGEQIRVTSIEHVYLNQTVYNIEVARNHNYFADGILVHNKAPLAIYLGCPYLATWDGEDYSTDNNLIPVSENYDRENLDIEESYILSERPELRDGFYSFRIKEYENDHSFFDSFKLAELIHPDDTYLAASQKDNSILAFDGPGVQSPISAFNEESSNVLNYIYDFDARSYYGAPGSWVELDFGQITSYDELDLLLYANTSYIEKTSLIIQVRDSNNVWQDVEKVTPHRIYSTQYVNLKDNLPDPNGDFKVRILWTSEHTLDAAVLYTGMNYPVQYNDCVLACGRQPIYGNITEKVQYTDGAYTDLYPADYILLDFIPSGIECDPGYIKDYIFTTVGHYFLLNPVGTSKLVECNFSIESDVNSEVNILVIRDVNTDGAYEVITSAHVSVDSIDSVNLSFDYHPEEDYSILLELPKNFTEYTSVNCTLNSDHGEAPIISNGIIDKYLQTPINSELKEITGLWAHEYSKEPFVYKNNPIDFQIVSRHFKDYSKQNMTAIHWNFGDGTESAEFNPIHSYSESGEYLVSVNMTFYYDSAFMNRTKYLVIHVPNVEPIPVIQVYEEVNINLEVAGRKGNTITLEIYEDGLLIESMPVTRTPGKPNEDDLSLNKYLDREYSFVLIYEAEYYDSNPIWLTFSSGDNSEVFFYEFNPANGVVQEVAVDSSLCDSALDGNMEFFFDASGSYDLDGYIMFHQWNFGDGSFAQIGEFVQHTFAQPGVYEVRLQVLDNEGAVSRETIELIVD